MSRGFILAALAAALYGTNPAFTVPLYILGLNPVSVLLYRYLLGVPLLIGFLHWRMERIMLYRQEWLPIAFLGLIMAFSSLTLYEAYRFINPGVASTLLFMYPILTALLMALFFHEKPGLITIACLALMCVGLYLLSWNSEGEAIDLWGVFLVLLSSLSYAIYLVIVRVAKNCQAIPTLTSLLWQLIFGSFLFIGLICLERNLVSPSGVHAWTNLLALAILPTLLSLLCTLKAIKLIGPTPTAIFGALEPVTAVLLSVLLLGETVSMREIAGGLLIIGATLMVVVQRELEKRIKRLFSRH